uniref:Pseudouridine synthase n=1 Tax=Dictyoglomus thermophilum TaxID=14 RepID=A0A7C3RN16_DICTH
MRLDRFLVNQGFGSRKEVQKLIKSGVVKVNEEVIDDPSYHIDPNKDIVNIDGEEIEYKENFYFMLNKPKGYITAAYDEKYPTVMDLFSSEPMIDKLFPIGRLDIDTEGLLIITSDGQLAHRITHPKWNIEKEYFVIVDGDVSDIDFSRYEKEGIYLKKEKYKTKPFKVEVLKTSPEESEILITITEGKYHIIKNIMSELKHEVLYLKRVRIGPLRLDEDLAPGEYRELTKEEIDMIKRSVKM